jgi:hypothetical protein
MGYQETMRIVRGSQRYVGSLDKNLMIPYALNNTTRNIIQNDRDLVLNLQDQYNREREESYTYRLYGKINPIVGNFVSGCTYDPVFMSYHLYYQPIPLSDQESLACGYPSIQFFDFITYTSLTSFHNYVELNSYLDNWVMYESYVNQNIQNWPMEYYSERHNPPELATGALNKGVSFNSGDGIPFHVENVTIQGKGAVKFICPVDHGLSPGEYIVLDQTVNAINTNVLLQINPPGGLGPSYPGNPQPVFSLGDENFNTESKIFNILLNDDDQVVNDGDVGVFKRLIDRENMNETLSQYYVHSHEILTKPTEYTLDKTGFEKGIYSKRAKTFQANNSPSAGVEHHVVKDEYPSYMWNFTNDLDVSDYSDNLGRPLKDLYISVFAVNETGIWKIRGNSCVGLGWDWNFTPDGKIDPYPNNVMEGNLSTPYNLPQSGDTFIGAFVEYNEWELKERIISEAYHKLTFNNVDTNGTSFYDPDPDSNLAAGTATDEIFGGYYYQPHTRIPIKTYSETVMTHKNYEFVPEYSNFSIHESLWRWRELLPTGFYESDMNGTDYPFVNGAHYPYKNINFEIKPIVIDIDYRTPPFVVLPTADDCE